MPLQASLEPFCRRIILVIQGFADGFEGLRSVTGQAHFDKVRMLRPLVRLSGPEGDVVQGKMLMDRIAVHHGAQAAVAHGQGFLEEGRRTVVMQAQSVLRDARTGGKHEQEGQDAFHHSTGLLSIGQPVRVDRTGMRE